MASGAHQDLVGQATRSGPPAPPQACGAAGRAGSRGTIDAAKASPPPSVGRRTLPPSRSAGPPPAPDPAEHGGSRRDVESLRAGQRECLVHVPALGQQPGRPLGQVIAGNPSHRASAEPPPLHRTLLVPRLGVYPVLQHREPQPARFQVGFVRRSGIAPHLLACPGRPARPRRPPRRPAHGVTAASLLVLRTSVVYASSAVNLP